MTFRGDLKEICLFDVFQSVSHNQLTGTLRVSTGDGESWVWFEGGKVRYASEGRGVGLPMRDFLVARGRVDEDELQEALRRHRRGRPALRNVLEREGKLDAESFASAFRERVVEFLYDLFAVKEASFEFDEGPPPNGVFDREQRGLDVAIDPLPVLVEAARRDDEWARIRRVVASGRDLFVRTGEEPSDPGLRRIWKLLDGHTEVGDLEGQVTLGRFELHDAVARLATSGAARAVAATEITAQAEEAMRTGDHARTRSLLEHALEIERNNRDLRRMLAELYEALEDPKQAVESWAILGYQAALDGEDDEALAAYRRAIALAPGDLRLREKAFELLERVGSSEAFAESVLDLADRFMELGLADRARDALDRAMRRPDIADRVELLVRFAAVERDRGRAAVGIDRIVHAAETARKAGDRRHAEELLRGGLQSFPESPRLLRLLEDLSSGRRERRRARVRRYASVLALSVFAAAAAFVAFDEILVRREVSALLHDIPAAVRGGRATEPLGAALAGYRAHPLTPSRRWFREIAQSLTDAELDEIRCAGSSGRYREALARLEGLRALVGEASVASVRGLREQLQHRQELYRILEPWFTDSRRPARERNLAAFEFEVKDMDQVLELYARFDKYARTHVRRRLAELGSPIALPLFTGRYLEGRDDRRQGAIPIYELIAKLAERARDPRWSTRLEVREAFHEAYMLAADTWLGDDTEAKPRARQLLPLFVDLPSRLPETRDGFLKLVKPAAHR